MIFPLGTNRFLIDGFFVLKGGRTIRELRQGQNTPHLRFISNPKRQNLASYLPPLLHFKVGIEIVKVYARGLNFPPLTLIHIMVMS